LLSARLKPCKSKAGEDDLIVGPERLRIPGARGAATFQLVTGTHRVKDVLYRRPGGTRWEKIPLDVAMQMVAERVRRVREETWEQDDPEGRPVRRTLGIAHLGGATLDNEENYLIKKLFTALGVVQVENQARI